MTDVPGSVGRLQLEDSPPGDIDDLLQLAKNQSGDTKPFYELEGQILDLWDRLNELKLEIAVLEAQNDAEAPGRVLRANDIQMPH